MACRQRALGILLLCLTACTSVLSDEEPAYYYDYMRTMEQALNATIEAGVPPDDVDRTDNGPGILFECPDYVTAKRGESVHELTPYDIGIIAAMGDSLTAAMGAQAKTIFSALTEYRGVSWSIGGDKDSLFVGSLGNYIKRYNPNVIGYSTGTGTRNAKYNVAVSGAKSENMPQQANDLVQKLKNDLGDDLAKPWKMVTLFIGGNDLCAYCDNPERYSPENHAEHIINALDILKAELPRTFVNVVHTLDVTVIGQLSGLFCNIVHGFVCNCKKDGNTKRAAELYREALEEQLAVRSEYYDSEDFTVVIQPFTAGIEDVPRDDKGKEDKSFFSPDCFHFSEKAHKDAALSLWNNMLEKVGEKELGWEHLPNPKCPSEDAPFFYTKMNSQQLFGVAGGPDNPDSNGSDGNLLAVLLGSGIGAYVVVMTLIVAVVGTVWYRRRRRQLHQQAGVSCDTEKITLLKN